MMIQIANPIYDSVFKYLMEDERIVLKKELWLKCAATSTQMVCETTSPCFV